MERMTKWNGKKWVLPQGYGVWREIAERLAAYENTGLEPDEINRKGENVNAYWEFVTDLYPGAQFDFFYRIGELHFWPDGAAKAAGKAPWGCIKKDGKFTIITEF